MSASSRGPSSPAPTAGITAPIGSAPPHQWVKTAIPPNLSLKTIQGGRLHERIQPRSLVAGANRRDYRADRVRPAPPMDKDRDPAKSLAQDDPRRQAP